MNADFDVTGVLQTIKIVVILAAITGVALFIEETWRLLHPRRLDLGETQ
jgi:hypothetical protein